MRYSKIYYKNTRSATGILPIVNVKNALVRNENINEKCVKYYTTVNVHVVND